MQKTSPFNILFVDDDLEEHDLLKMALRSIHHINLISLNDGISMEEYLEDHHNSLPDIIVIDMSIYCKTEPNCVDAIRKNAAYKNIPLVIYSGSTHDSMITELFHKGANLFIHKGDSLDLTKEVFEKLLKINWRHHMSKPKIENFLFQHAKYIGK